MEVGGKEGKTDTPAPQAIIKSVDMKEEDQKVAIEVTTEAMGLFEIEKDIAAHIKKKFDEKFGATWHAVVGKNFGSYCTHETGHFIYFYMGNIAILLFKAG
ncbi:hypothetical protein T439DRAFT_325782 [Meredithblackwellia eburnea MCA 4105]